MTRADSLNPSLSSTSAPVSRSTRKIKGERAPGGRGWQRLLRYGNDLRRRGFDLRSRIEKILSAETPVRV